MGTYTISHNYQDGTLLYGTTRDDTRKGTPLRDLLTLHGWRWFPSAAAWGKRNSRNKPANQFAINEMRAGLEQLGHTVTVDINNTVRDTADIEAEREARAEARAEHYQARAQRRAAQSAANYQAWRDHTDNIPLGQPLLAGHHSYNSDKRRRERAAAKIDKSIELAEQARYWQQRAETAANETARRNHPVTVANRIHKLEAELRSRHINDEWRAKKEVDLAYWREVRAKQIADGLVQDLGPHNVKASDYVKDRRGWYEVVKVNKVSVTVNFMRGAAGQWLTNKLPYRELVAVKSPDDNNPIPQPPA